VAPRDDAALAAQIGLSPESVARARRLHGLVVGGPGTRDQRIAAWNRLTGGAGLGEALVGALVDRGPVGALVELITVRGIAEKRLCVLTLALASAPAPLADPLLEREDLLARLAAAQSDVARLQAEVTTLQARLDALPAPTVTATGARGVVAVSTLAQSAGEQLGRTAKQLRQDGHPLRLAGLGLTLRGPAGTDELARIGLRLDEDGAPAAGSPSELKLAFLPGDAPPSPTGAGRVPDVIGYTETLARRKLEARGYPVLTRATGALKPSEIGRVVRQIPAPEQAHDLGEAVELLVAR